MRAALLLAMMAGMAWGAAPLARLTPEQQKLAQERVRLWDSGAKAWKDGKQEEYLTLRFAENATLHVPAARINLIQKYIGGFSGHPTLSRLGSGVWEKQKAKVSEAVICATGWLEAARL